MGYILLCLYKRKWPTLWKALFCVDTPHQFILVLYPTWPASRALMCISRNNSWSSLCSQLPHMQRSFSDSSAMGASECTGLSQRPTVSGQWASGRTCTLWRLKWGDPTASALSPAPHSLLHPPSSRSRSHLPLTGVFVLFLSGFFSTFPHLYCITFCSLVVPTQFTGSAVIADSIPRERSPAHHQFLFYFAFCHHVSVPLECGHKAFSSC